MLCGDEGITGWLQSNLAYFFLLFNTFCSRCVTTILIALKKSAYNFPVPLLALLKADAILTIFARLCKRRDIYPVSFSSLHFNLNIRSIHSRCAFNVSRTKNSTFKKSLGQAFLIDLFLDLPELWVFCLSYWVFPLEFWGNVWKFQKLNILL